MDTVGKPGEFPTMAVEIQETSDPKILTQPSNQPLCMEDRGE